MVLIMVQFIELFLITEGAHPYKLSILFQSTQVKER